MKKVLADWSEERLIYPTNDREFSALLIESVFYHNCC